MRISAIILARTLAFVERFDLDPEGRIPIADLIKGIADRYKFQRLPKREEWDKEGLIFEDGKIGNKVIKKLVLYDVLIALETRTNTTESKQLIEEMLEWGVAKFGLKYGPASIKRFAYVSDVTFHSDLPLLDKACDPLSTIAAKTSAALSEIWGESISYQAINLSVGHDPLTRKSAIAPFSISRRQEARFSENKYFSEAPLPTDIHIQILEQFEKDVLLYSGKASTV